MTTPRPYTTHYFASVNDAEGEYASQGHAGSEVGAIRASVVRVFLKEYERARVYLDGALIYTLTRRAGGIDLTYGRSELSRTRHARRRRADHVQVL